MKTTIEIADALLEEAKELARSEGTTLRALVEEGLRAALKRRCEPAKPFELRDVRFKGGGGLTPEFKDARWDQIRDEIYRGHGA
jgi:hypothetical protein